MENHHNLDNQSSHHGGEPASNDAARLVPAPRTEPLLDEHPEPGGGSDDRAPTRPCLVALCFDLCHELGARLGYQKHPPEPIEVAFWCLAFEDVTLAYAPSGDGDGRSIIREFGSPEHACRALAPIAGPLRPVRL